MAMSSVAFRVHVLTVTCILLALAVVNEGAGVCSSGAAQDFPTLCYFNSDPQGRYVCCDAEGCDGFNSDNLTPHCKNNGFVPPGVDVGVSNPPPPTPSGDQGVCGSGAATDFPSRCYFNSDPLGRYVCCDGQGCDGFNSDNLVPHCKNNGFVPPGFGVSNPNPIPPTQPSTGDQGVCGSGDAQAFPTRCYFNSDPQGRYVCCDGQGCDGFNADNLTPHCKNYGFVPPNYGGSSGPARSPPSDQCPGVTFDVGALATAGAACTGDSISLRPCCFAVIKLWEDLAIADPQAASTLGIASIDTNAEQSCIEYTQEALRPYGVTAGLAQICSGPLSLAFKPSTICPTKDVPADIAQHVIDTCAGVAPDDVCGSCFDAFFGAVFYLLYPPGSPPPTGPPVFQPGNPALECLDVVLARLVARDPSFYRASALLDMQFGQGGCTVTPPPGSPS